MSFEPKRLLRFLASFIFIGMIVAYSIYQSRAIIAGPTITIASPQSDLIATTSLIHIRGTVTRAHEITLQGRPIFVDLEGRFSEQLLPMDGYNIIEITAKGVEGRVEKRTIELFYTRAQAT